MTLPEGIINRCVQLDNVLRYLPAKAAKALVQRMALGFVKIQKRLVNIPQNCRKLFHMVAFL